MSQKSRSSSETRDNEGLIATNCLDQFCVCALRIDQRGKILFGNKNAIQTLGYSNNELLEMSLGDIVPSIEDTDWSAIWETLCEDNQCSCEHHVQPRNRSAFPAEICISLINLEDARYAFALIYDSSERKQIHDSLLVSQFIFDHAPLGIFFIKSGGTIINVNEHACQYLGYSKDELCTMNVLDLDRGYTPKEIDEIWENQQRVRGVDIFETIHRCKDGTEIPVEINGILLEYNNEPYSVSFVKDISERKSSERRRLDLEARIRDSQRMESLGTLAGGIAHDFNNILSAILGYAELSKLSCADNHTLTKYIAQISKAGLRAKELVQQILQFSRQNQSEKKPINASDVVGEALRLIQASLPANIEIKSIIPQNLSPIVANETSIHQIVMNLCANSSHAMKQQGGSLEITLSEVIIHNFDIPFFQDINPGKFLNLSIADTGCGIPPEIINRIFEPYFTTKEIGEGTGLGLSTIHGIVKDHGGAIKVYSEVGIGTTFQIFLPSTEKPTQAIVQGTEHLPSGNGHILFVDDEQSLIELGRILLERLGYHVETRASALDALEAFRADPSKYDLVITDVTMPKMTGDQLARKIRELRPDVPVILCSGFSERIESKAIATDANNFVLLKPILYADLAHTVHKAIRK